MQQIMAGVASGTPSTAGQDKDLTRPEQVVVHQAEGAPQVPSLEWEAFESD